VRGWKRAGPMASAARRATLVRDSPPILGEKLVRGCGQQGADFDNWPFDALERIAGADEGQRNALAALRDSAKKAAERLAADCPQDVGAAPTARLEAVEQGIDATLAAFDTVEPALQSFYGALDDEQKARLYRDMMAAPAAADARETGGARRRTSDASAESIYPAVIAPAPMPRRERLPRASPPHVKLPRPAPPGPRCAKSLRRCCAAGRCARSSATCV